MSFPAVAAATAGADGKRCIDKVEMVEETEYDEVVQCDHSYDRRYVFFLKAFFLKLQSYNIQY